MTLGTGNSYDTRGEAADRRQEALEREQVEWLKTVDRKAVTEALVRFSTEGLDALEPWLPIELSVLRLSWGVILEARGPVVTGRLGHYFDLNGPDPLENPGE